MMKDIKRGRGSAILLLEDEYQNDTAFSGELNRMQKPRRREGRREGQSLNRGGGGKDRERESQGP